MPQFESQKVASAQVNHSKLDLSSTHITTSSFMQAQPVYYRHMLPKEHIHGSASVLSRLAPVAVPTYGRCRINMRAFFVPFRCVFPNFNEFIVDTIASNASNSSLVATSPKILNVEFVSMFTTRSAFGVPLASLVVDQVNDPYDFNLGAGQHYALSYFGRLFLKILHSLGYKVIWDTKDQFDWSALGLLCYAKAYLDWYSNQAYRDSASYLQIERYFKYNDPTGTLTLTADDLVTLLSYCCICCYDNGNDVYLNAWDNPVAPNAGLYSSGISMNDITSSTYPATGVVLDSNGTPTMIQTANTDVTIGTTYIHQMLKAMTDYVKRNQLSGAAQVDRFLTRFGINLDSSKVDRSIYISSQSVDIDFGSVMQTVNTAAAGNPSNLGDYAGAGRGQGNFDFDFVAEEFGVFVVISSIQPQGNLYQGFDRNNLHLDKMDFYQPEFDNLGVQAISKGEVYVSNNSNFGQAPAYKGVFGYAPRLYEYKQKSDFVTGDFISDPTMIGGSAWHLERKLSDINFVNVSGLTHSLQFTRGNDSFSYDRIFQYTAPDVDKFYLVYHFGVMSLAPCKSLFDTYDFDEFGKQLTMASNGAKVN